MTAGLVLHAHDRAEHDIAFQLLVYPMLDDRTVTRTDLNHVPARMWTTKSNRLGWSVYIGCEPGTSDVSHNAAPGRRTDLSGLPPTWIGVGELDLFHDEDVDYAGRLRAAGIPCHLEVVPGAFHGFDQLYWNTSVAQRFWHSQCEALRIAGIDSR